MPNLHLAGPELPWGSGSTLHAAGPELPWGYGITLHATPSAYTPGPPPGGGGTPTGPVPVTPGAIIPARASYDVTHTMSVVDLRDGAALDVTSLSLGIDADSALWTLRASGSGSLYGKMMAGDQPAQIEVTLDGLQWVFAVDTVSRSRAAGQSNCDITGRSLAVAAGAPYAGDQNWINDGPTTGAQLAAIANLYSGLDVSWEVEDWLIPDRVFSFSGTPLAVVLRVAEAIGAVVQADRSACKVRVMPRYLLLPNEWGTVAPDVEVAFEAVLSERFERADQPEYTGVYVSGQQQGAVGFVRLEGTSGAFLHPLVTDLLLTDEPALRQRGQAILGASGGQARVTLELPVLTGAGEPGVLSVGQLLRVLDPAAAWVGLVRAVQVQATLPTVRQTVEVERHTKLLQGSDLHFNGPIPAQTGKVGDAFTALDLTGYWAGGIKPYQFSVASGALPAGLALDPVAGIVSGTPTADGATTVRFRAVDRLLGAADSGDVSVVVAPEPILFRDLGPSANHFAPNAGVSLETGGPTLFGTRAYRFDGIGGSGTAAADLAAHEIHNEAVWTIDLWLRMHAVPAAVLACPFGKAQANNQSYYLGVQAGSPAFYYSTGGSANSLVVTGGGTIPVDTWRYVRIVRNGVRLYFFLHGVLVASHNTMTNFYDSTAPMTFGQIGVGGYEYWWPGYIRDFRITKGVARSVADFAVPTAPAPSNSTDDPHWANVSALYRCGPT